MELTVEKRDILIKPHTLRKKGLLPAVVYGRGQESTPITIDTKTFQKLFRQAGESTVITLKGLDGDKDALIHEVSVHAVSGLPLHADFYAIQKGQKVTVAIPFEFEGVSPAVKDKGAVLMKIMHELEIECEPKDLPQHIVVDISTLVNIDDKIVVGDLKLPASAKVSLESDEVVAMVSEATEEVESAPIDIADIGSSVERGKKPEEPESDAE
ncbi:MAG: 50S ribosomal protein L25 [bacterium]